MDYYDIWCDLTDSSEDLAWCDAIARYLDFLKAKGLLETYSVRRRKLGFSPDALGEFNVSIGCRDLAQLDAAFQRAATRDSEVEPLHREVYRRIKNARFALYRDYPDPVRVPPEPMR